MKYFLLNLLLIFFSGNSLGQNQNKSTEPCNCEIVFKDLVEKLENNYIALAQKRLAGSDKAYEARKTLYSERSAEVDAENCTAFLDDFLSFFEDGHLSVFEYPNYSETEVSGFKEEIKKRKITRDMLDRMILNDSTSIRSSSDKILGKWTDGKSDFIVTKNKDVYKAYILESTVEGIEFGECKAIFSPNSDGYLVEYYYNYSKRYTSGDVYKEDLVLRGGGLFWIRKESPFKRELESIDKINFKSPSIIKLDEKNTIISLLSFSLGYKSFNDFIKENKHLIINSENLIIDIRGNTGGNGIYFPLIALYATQNMEGSQGLVLASLDNLSYFERQRKYSKKVFKPVVNRIKSNQGEIIDGPSYPGKKFKTPKKSKIKNVAILTDEGCASASESFILHSKRSSTKVKIFGAPTEGTIDYTSVTSILLNSGKQYIYFRYPTSTLNKEIPNNGYNKTGIIPDIPIQNDVKDKVDFIIRYYQEE